MINNTLGLEMKQFNALLVKVEINGTLREAHHNLQNQSTNITYFKNREHRTYT